MKFLPLMGSILTVSLLIGAPAAIAHVGHGDEFQSTGGINRVEVKSETDSILGIRTAPIEPAADGSTAVLFPVTALIDDNGQQLVFVQYESFYEPVPVTTSSTQGDLIEVAEGLAVGEQLVTEGSLALYAESRKTQAAEAPTAEGEFAAPVTDQTHAQADAQGTPHSHDPSGNLAASGEVEQASGGFPIGIAATAALGVVLAGGAFALVGSNRKG
ncbi:MAG: cobalt transporter [Phormidesmis priestleyi]|uniref:Cobalt transporter n=1 Tax=Phormidesmis priestleyi TaxID=268141 RepID=A0A2W4XAD8_9CYAN|nr:MAG: cobalt transporter [Phormidesmis priestleyi]